MRYLDSFAQEAVPYAQQTIPGQGARESAQEPFCRVQHGLHFVFDEVTVYGWGCATEQRVEDVAVALEHLKITEKGTVLGLLLRPACFIVLCVPTFLRIRDNLSSEDVFIMTISYSFLKAHAL